MLSKVAIGLGLVGAAQGAVMKKHSVRGADPIFSEDWSSGIDFTVWKHGT